MSMPQIPEERHRPSLKETVIDLLESIALEEIALSHLVNAEAEKIQTVLKKDPCEKFLLQVNHSVKSVMDTVVMKEWLLLKKLDEVLRIEVEEFEECHERECCEE